MHLDPMEDFVASTYPLFSWQSNLSGRKKVNSLGGKIQKWCMSKEDSVPSGKAISDYLMKILSLRSSD